MKAELRFKPGTLRLVNAQWMVDGAIKEVSPTGWSASPVSGIRVASDLVDWLRDLEKALLYHVPRDQVQSVRPHVTSDFFLVDTDEELYVSGVYPDVIVPRSADPGPRQFSSQRSYLTPVLEETIGAVRDVIAGSVWAELRRHCPDPSFVLPPGHGLTPSYGMCRVTALSALSVLMDILPDGDWRMAGGHPSYYYQQDFPEGTFIPGSGDGGMWSCDTQSWRGHYWIQGKLDGDPVIIDMTADQFGWSPLIVTSVADERYRANFSPAKITSMSSDPVIERLVSLALSEWSQRHHQTTLSF